LHANIDAVFEIVPINTHLPEENNNTVALGFFSLIIRPENLFGLYSTFHNFRAAHDRLILHPTKKVQDMFVMIGIEKIINENIFINSFV
jgi:hypothetical protein